jgi:hypothetical protein
MGLVKQENERQIAPGAAHYTAGQGDSGGPPGS